MTNVIRNTTRVLRGLFLFRLFTLIFGGMMLAIRLSTIGPAPVTDMHPTWGLTMLPSLLAMVYVLLPGLQKKLGKWYLPIALALTILGFAVESSVEYLFPGIAVRITLSSGREFNIAWAPTEMILLLLLPCMLGGAAYGTRGALRTAHFATLLHLLTGIAVWTWGTSPRGFLVLLPLRVAVLYVFPLIAGYLSDTWRKEHEALGAANRHLRGYATTVEHLATSRERVRLARAMHDTLAHTLASLVVQFEAVDTLQETDPQAARVQIEKIKAQTRLGLDEARRAIQDLRAAPVEDLGLVEAIRQLARQFEQQNGVPVTCQVQGAPFPLLPVQSNALYRIAEEALTNVERHAEAGTLTISLDYDTGITLTVQDDGQGFDPDAIPDDRYGLLGICERAELIDATVRLETAPQQGTRLVVQIAKPWEPER
ncbi:MAG: sensor histidine kinase [Anaerolineae bacterium]|nr:sensor histidine kinase [Anaerolineae bacterium]